MDDTISRQEAIKAIEAYFGDLPIKGHYDMLQLIKQLPSAQPEPLTDSEQRIFLAAMAREEKVCKEVDELWRDSREPYEDSLVRVCREIERKVKGALWTS